MRQNKRGFFGIVKKKKLSVRTPLCCTCWHRIINGTLPCDAKPSDLIVINELRKLEIESASIAKSTSLDDISKLVEAIESMTPIYDVCKADFNRLANETSKAAERMEWISSSINRAKERAEQRFNVSYKIARREANLIAQNRQLRIRVFARDGFKCLHCGSTEFLSLDHIIPVYRGGKTEYENLQTLCLTCNCSKGKSNNSSALSSIGATLFLVSHRADGGSAEGLNE